MKRWCVIALCACGAPTAPASAPRAEPAAPMPPAHGFGGPPMSPPAESPGQEQAPEVIAASARRRDRKPVAATSEADALVAAHNRRRARHCARPLTWSVKLAEVAQRWATALRDKGCAFGHSGGKYGENLAAGTSGTLDAEAVVGMWYDEVADYRFPDGGFSMKTGHFTQVVWRGTTQVGCGRSQCKDMDIWVCEYDPPGNWEGQYRENVLPTSCK